VAAMVQLHIVAAMVYTVAAMVQIAPAISHSIAMKTAPATIVFLTYARRTVLLTTVKSDLPIPK